MSQIAFACAQHLLITCISHSRFKRFWMVILAVGHSIDSTHTEPYATRLSMVNGLSMSSLPQHLSSTLRQVGAVSRSPFTNCLETQRRKQLKCQPFQRSQVISVFTCSWCIGTLPSPLCLIHTCANRGATPNIILAGSDNKSLLLPRISIPATTNDQV